MNNYLEGGKQQMLHLGYLDSLRALAAIYVVLYHAMLHFRIPVNSLVYRLTFVIRHGHNAVNFFIVLSGFCLMLPILHNDGVLRGGTWTFLKKRARRILPPYYIAMLLSLFFIYTLIGSKTGTLWDKSLPVTARDIFYHIIMIQDIAAHNINYVFWSISVEWRIYFLFPLLVVWWRHWGAGKVTIMVLVLSVLIWYGLLQTSLNMTPSGINPHYLGLFTLGMFAAHVAFAPEEAMVLLRSRIGWKTFFIITAVNMALVGSGHMLMQKKFLPNYTGIEDLAIGLYITWFLIMLETGKLSLIHRLLSWKPLVFVGGFAYSIYLIHAPLLQILWQYVLQPLNLGLVPGLIFLITVGTSFCLGASYLFFLIAEQPFITKSKTAAVTLVKSSS
jgi:peptidoglycan/LPS O-acetylase OafA/YrhL